MLALVGAPPPVRADDIRITSVETTPGLRADGVKRALDANLERLRTCAARWYSNSRACRLAAKPVLLSDDADHRVAISLDLVPAESRAPDWAEEEAPSRVSEIRVSGLRLDPWCVEEVVKSIRFPPLSSLAPQVTVVATLDVNVIEPELAKLRESLRTQVQTFCVSLDRVARDAPKKESEWLTRAAALMNAPAGLDPRVKKIVYTSGLLQPEHGPGFLWSSAQDLGIDEPCASSAAWKRIRRSPCVSEE
jgi:hypothetical protein